MPPTPPMAPPSMPTPDRQPGQPIPSLTMPLTSPITCSPTQPYDPPPPRHTPLHGFITLVSLRSRIGRRLSLRPHHFAGPLTGLRHPHLPHVSEVGRFQPKASSPGAHGCRARAPVRAHGAFVRGAGASGQDGPWTEKTHLSGRRTLSKFVGSRPSSDRSWVDLPNTLGSGRV